MFEKIKKNINIKYNKAVFSLLTSVLTVFLLWGVFFAQHAFSDGVTFARNGDSEQQTFPAFIEMGEIIANGIVDGVDIFTVNGSASIHSNGLEWYCIYRIFAYFGKLTSPLGMFIAFYMLHTFINMYFTQRLCQVCFKMPSKLALLIAISTLTTGFYNVWFVSFYVIESLVVPLIYGIICMLKSESKVFCVLSSIFYIAALTSGYSIISCFLALIVFLYSLVYAISYNINNKKNIIIRAFISASLGVGICIPYLLTLFIGNMKSENVRNGMSLSNAISYSLEPTVSLPKAFFFSDTASFYEQELWIGTIWAFLLVLFVSVRVTNKLKKKEKIFFWIGILGSVLIFLIDMKEVLPFEKWFYMIPVFGGMHLRRRFLIVFTPLLFISFGIAIMKLRHRYNKKILIPTSIVYILLMFGLYMLATKDFNKNALIIELILTSIALYLGMANGFLSKNFLLIFSLIMLCYNANILYGTEEVTVSNDIIKNRCLAFDAEKQVVLDEFIEHLPRKEIYKYVSAEDTEVDVPIYVQASYGWYHSQNKILSNYFGYPFHFFSDEYKASFGVGWYNSFDANYLRDTRADFAILTQGARDKNPNNYNLSSDMECVYLNDAVFCAKLEKYIPRHYTNGAELVIDENNSLDNGYFYCPILDNDDIKKFETDHHTYFEITVDVNADTDLQYSRFPCDKYSYYIDGKKYEPNLDYGLAYFELTPGQHNIKIIYKDKLQNLVFWIFSFYYMAFLFGGAFSYIYVCVGKKKYKFNFVKGNQ